VRILGIEGPQKRARQAVEKADHRAGLRIGMTRDPIGPAKAYSRPPNRKLLPEGGDSRL
jgi:hypothetical protein